MLKPELRQKPCSQYLLNNPKDKDKIKTELFDMTYVIQNWTDQSGLMALGWLVSSLASCFLFQLLSVANALEAAWLEPPPGALLCRSGLRCYCRHLLWNVSRLLSSLPALWQSSGSGLSVCAGLLSIRQLPARPLPCRPRSPAATPVGMDGVSIWERKLVSLTKNLSVSLTTCLISQRIESVVIGKTRVPGEYVSIRNTFDCPL